MLPFYAPMCCFLADFPEISSYFPLDFITLDSVALAGTACWLALTGVLELPMMLMICFFSFGIFAGLEPISDSAHVLSVINNAMDQLDALRETLEMPSGMAWASRSSMDSMSSMNIFLRTPTPFS